MREKHYRNKKDYRHYRTTNLYLAAYLYAHNLPLVNIDKTDPKKCTFVFKDSPEREELASRFMFGKEAPVDARLYSDAICELKIKLHDTTF
jgi:Domain of unknown function (DUF5659)